MVQGIQTGRQQNRRETNEDSKCPKTAEKGEREYAAR